MRQTIHGKSVVRVLTALTLVSSIIVTVLLYGATTAGAASPPKTTKSAFCNNLGKRYQASSGAQMYCFGLQKSGTGQLTPSNQTKTFGTNVDAASFSEDISPAGVRLYGQSEVSIAGIGSYVVEAWNDSTSFASSCGSAMYKEENTGFGFSNDGGKSFVDLGGLPNANCNNAIYNGDPSVEVRKVEGTTYFYISSLYNPVSPLTGPPTDVRSYIAMDACKVSGSGSGASLVCSNPIIIAASSQCQTQNGNTFCSFLDKDFLSIDPARGRLYASFTEFGQKGSIVELAVCDIGTSSGGTGASGGTAGTPVCKNGGAGTQLAPKAPYFVVAPPDPNFCENEGAYPAVNTATGDVYVAYEHNWTTSMFNFPGNVCTSDPIQNVVDYIPYSCLTLTTTAFCAGPAAQNAVNVISMEAAFIPGYSRFPMSDFPRIAVSSQQGTVSIVWNDARLHPVGDILLQSFSLKSLTAIQSSPVRLNSSVGGWHLLPALRNADANGNLSVVFYGRNSATTAVTNTYTAANVNPRTASAPASNTLISTASSNWFNVSADITPNFGDYTDAYVIATSSAPFTGTHVYAAWSDGRLGVPQPFEAHT